LDEGGVDAGELGEGRRSRRRRIKQTGKREIDGRNESEKNREGKHD